MIKVSFQLTRQELLTGMLTIARSRRSVRISGGIGILFIVVSVLIFAANFMLGLDAFWLALAFFAISLYITFQLDILIWYQVKNLVKQHAQITEPMSYTFQESWYEFEGQSFMTRMDYSKLYEVLERRNFILFKIHHASAHIVPRRAFSAAQFDLLKEIIRSVPNLKSSFKS